MSKIAANETYGGNMLRKAIDYFCHLAVAPDFMGRIEKGDKAFAASEFFPQMRWLKDVNDDIYDPTYTDMLRVAFTAEFGRGKGFLSRDITVNDLIMNRSDVHHVYPRKHLKKQGLARGRYNQIANFVLAQSEINIAIGDKAPETYFTDLAKQCDGGPKKYGGITEREELCANLRMSCLPELLIDGVVPAYDDFLEQRRKLMALKIKAWFDAL